MTAGSMRFTLDEVLAGMLATVGVDAFTDDHARLASMFEVLAAEHALFAPLAAGVDAGAVEAALAKLVAHGTLTHEGDHYSLSAASRAHCIGSKRMLFNAQDREELEAAAQSFSTLAA